MDTPRGSSRNGAGKNDCASSLKADYTNALQRKRQESFSFRRKGKMANNNLKNNLERTRTTQQANRAPSPSEWGMRVGAAYTQTGVLAKGRVKGSAGEIEELGREQGLVPFDFCD